MPAESRKRPRTNKEQTLATKRSSSSRPAAVLKRPAAAVHALQRAELGASANTPRRRLPTPVRNLTEAPIVSIGEAAKKSESVLSKSLDGAGSIKNDNASISRMDADNSEQCHVQVPQSMKQRVVQSVYEHSVAPSSHSSASIASGRGGNLNSAPAGHGENVAFMRLSMECSPSTHIERLVYLDKDDMSFGRLPSNSVILDSSRFPNMISRIHGRVRRSHDSRKFVEWTIVNNSLNGIYVNEQAIGQEGHRLQHADIIRFGRKVSPPEFEFVFEEPAAAAADAVQEHFAEQARRIAELERKLQAERDQEISESQQRGAARAALDVADIQSELICSICRDWVVHASTIECAHSFCWSCIDQWLRQKKFECPVCRQVVTREPVRSHTIEAIVHKTIDRGGADSKADYRDRVRAAEENEERLQKLHHELQASMTDALQKGISFPQIEAIWGRRQKDSFQQDVKDYSGVTRETYCGLRNLTVQWVHSADDSKLNLALHNLGLQAFVGSTEEDIRKRLLMFLRYG